MRSFLLISPPKSGTTWIRENMSKIIGKPMIEGEPYMFGEARWSITSVSALLTKNQLKTWAEYKPKVLFLFREPISRYWSALKHNFRYQELHFAHPKFGNMKIEDVELKDWLLAAFRPMSIALANYDACYTRAKSFFPPEDTRIDFFDSIVDNPRGFIKKISDWVGVECNEDFEPSGIANPGMKLDMPECLGPIFSDLSVCSFAPRHWTKGKFMTTESIQTIADNLMYYKGY